MSNTINEFLSWVDTFLNFEKLPQKNMFWLDTMEILCRHLDNPQDKIPCFHVAGSKGKGSVSQMISSILTESGKRVGVYSSPHIEDFRERIRLNDAFFADEIYKNASEKLISKFNLIKNELTKERAVTWFELVTVFAFLCFEEAHVDENVLEVGLGGRLDATNIVRPELSIINTIELEHTEFLGDTLEKIATEKAGIIKPGIPVISAPQTEEVKNVFKRIASERGSKIYFLDEKDLNAKFDFNYNLNDFKNEENSNCKNSILQNLNCKNLNYQKVMNVKLSSSLFKREINFNTKMFGKIQAQNALLSALSVKFVHPEITEEQIERGLGKVFLPARFEIIKEKNIDLIIDGAHTVKSIALTLETFNALYKNSAQNNAAKTNIENKNCDLQKNQNANLLFACAADKDVEHIARLFAYDCDKEKINFEKVTLTRPGNTKTCDVSKMKNAFCDAKINFTYDENFERAIKNSIEYSIKNNQNLLVVGSFYLASEVKKVLKNYSM